MDYFGILGLAPGIHSERVVRQSFLSRRDALLEEMRRPERQDDARQALDALHRAYRVLRTPSDQAAQLDAGMLATSATEHLRRMIAELLEDGLLRYSRRRAVLEEARLLGVSEFQAHLLIAQVQYGEVSVPLGPTQTRRRRQAETAEIWTRLAAAGAMATVIFAAMMRWVGS
jgi:hypothetical protein